MTKHLDLGCGLKPRNPYGAAETYGCDVRHIDLAVEKIGFEYKRVNLVVEPIPYPDGFLTRSRPSIFWSTSPGKWSCPTAR